MSDSLLERLILLQQDSEALLMRQLGDETACTIQRDGRVTGGLKYAEGRMVALHSLIRLARSAVAGSDLRAQLEAERIEWQQRRADARRLTPPSMPWLAYAQGGIDACNDALALLP